MSSTEVGTRGAATVIAATKTIAEATPDTRDGLMGKPTATTITHPAGDSKTCGFLRLQDRDLGTDGFSIDQPQARRL